MWGGMSGRIEKLLKELDDVDEADVLNGNKGEEFCVSAAGMNFLIPDSLEECVSCIAVEYIHPDHQNQNDVYIIHWFFVVSLGDPRLG